LSLDPLASANKPPLTAAATFVCKKGADYKLLKHLTAAVSVPDSVYDQMAVKMM
jgi:hypothetical protein